MVLATRSFAASTHRSETDPWRRRNKHDSSELRDILDRFSDARSVIATACSALDETRDHCVDEVITVRLGLRLLAEVYDDPDRAVALASQRARRSRS